MKADQPIDTELRDLYRDRYVAGYHREAGRRLERLLPRMDLSPSMTVADLGCGNGLLLDLIHNRIGTYHGVDFSEEFVSEARQRHAGRGGCDVHFSCQSITDFCTAHPREIDRAFCLDFVEHVANEELLPTLRAIRSCLAPSGWLYVHTPNAEFMLEILKNHGVLKQLPEHIAVRSPAAISALLETAGFSDLRVTPLPHYLRALAPLHLLAHLPLCGRFFRARLFIACRP